MNREIRHAFSKHLTSIGFELNATKDAILDKLLAHMGEQRFNEVMNRQFETPEQGEDYYAQFKDIVEGNLMRSLDPGATLEASMSLYERCRARLKVNARVLELGSWTGGLASFVAMRHPDCSVCGVDISHRIIECCNSHYHLPNLSFRRWNYRFGKPVDIEPADVLLCSLGVTHPSSSEDTPSDPCDIRKSSDYVTQRDHAIAYFRAWRSAAKPGAHLLAVLRVHLLPRFLAWIDAAQQTGWKPELDRLWHVDFTEDNHPLPGLLFVAEPCAPIEEQAALDRWSWFQCPTQIFANLQGAAALSMYRSLQNRTPLLSGQYHRKGVATQEELGLNQNVGYIFAHNARRYRLVFISHIKARELVPKMQTQHAQNESLIKCLDNAGWPSTAGSVATSVKESR